MVMQHYRWDFYGLSTQEKPTPEQSEKVVNGSTFYCADTSKLYVFCDGTWYEKTVSGGGGGSSYTAGDGIDITNDVISATNTGKAKELTTADYNYPADNPTSVGLWLLPEGFYVQGTDVRVNVDRNTSIGGISAGYFLVGKEDAYGRTHITSFSSNDVYYYVTTRSTGVSVLTRKLDTVVVQNTGTSTEDVMSQKATTNMFYKTANSSLSSIGIGYNTIANIGSGTEGNVVIGNSINTVTTNRNVMIGESTQGATSGSYCGTAIGTGAKANATCSVALGSYATANTQGQFDVSTGSQLTSGYNSSKYRLLTGLYDGQSDHDAATYGQLNTRLDGLNLLQITQTVYDALPTKDPNTLYIIVGA